MSLLQSSDFSSLDAYYIYLGAAGNDAQTNLQLALIYGSEATLFTYLNANSTKQQVAAILGFGGRFKGGIFLNPNTYPVFLKIYDALAVDVTIGTTPTNYKIQIPANGQVVLDSPKVYLNLANGLTFAVTKFYEDTDLTVLATNCEISISYETS